MLSYEEAPRIFAGVSRVIVDEIHALAESKRGDQLMLGLARLQTLAPAMRRVGLSATVEDPPALAAFLGEGARVLARRPRPRARHHASSQTEEPPPWAGQTARYAARAVMDLIRGATHHARLHQHPRPGRALLPVALGRERRGPADRAPPRLAQPRGRASRSRRRWSPGALRAIVATGSLDLGIDWGDVDLVIQVGAPKNVKRLVQRIGRANHRYNAPSRAVLVPANRFEVLECRAALDAVRAHDLDGEPRGPGPLDVLCQHILLTACAGPFDADALFAEVRTAGPYRGLARADFDACLAFCATGGYALRAYDRWQRLVLSGRPLAAARPAPRAGDPDERRHHRRHREARRSGSRAAALPLGEIEEDFAATLAPGDTFLIGGETVRYECLREMTVEVTRQPSRQPKIADVRRHQARHLDAALAPRGRAPRRPRGLGRAARLHARLARAAAEVSRLPEPGRLLVETFPRGRPRAPLPLRLRRPQRPPDPRPPAHPPDGDRRPRTRSASSPTTTRC